MKTGSLVVTMSVLLASIVCAERMPPAKVDPVSDNGIEYRATHEKMGFVEAWDKTVGKKLWEKQVYTVKIDPKVEEDVQWVFITKLEIDGGKLIVMNERTDRYSVDLKTREVSKLVKEEKVAKE